MRSDNEKLKVFMFPWLAHGHMSPFLELAKELCDRNFIIYLCSSPVNLESVRGEVFEGRYKGLIELVELDIPAMKELPAHCHTTKNIPSHQMHLLKKAFDRSFIHFSQLLNDYKPDFLIYDTIQPWAPVIANRYNIPAVAFISTSATMTSFMIHHHDSPGVEFPFSNIFLHGHEAASFIHLTESRENYYLGQNRFVESIKKSNGIVLVKSSIEIEEKYIDHLSAQTGKKVICVGPLVQVPKSSNDHDNDDMIIQWLGTKELNSTVFVSFGSEYFLTKEEIKEVSRGLELSKVNFIWVVRFPKENNSKIEEILPDYFLEKTKGRGLVVQGWAPQVKILKHANIGGFVSHCGWSSVMEGINYNVPIIAVPMHLDQHINARLVTEMGVGVEVQRLKGRLEGKRIARVVRRVVEGKVGREARRREKEMSEKIKESEDKVLGGVIHEFARLWRKKHGVYNGVLEDY